jgi:hypothetical protein
VLKLLDKSCPHESERIRNSWNKRNHFPIDQSEVLSVTSERQTIDPTSQADEETESFEDTGRSNGINMVSLQLDD